MSNPKVAIIMRTKERSLLLKRSILSVLRQTFTDWHLVVVNDGGCAVAAEQTIDSFKELLQGRYTLLHHETSKGASAASNTGIKNSKSIYIAALDDDDTWEPAFLEETIKTLENQPSNSSVKGVATYSKYVHEVIKESEVHQESFGKYPLQPQLISLSNLLLGNQFTNHSFVYFREALEKVGYFDEQFVFFEDWDFNIRFALHYEIALLPLFLVTYHFRLPGSSGICENSFGLKKNKDLDMAHFRDQLLRRDLAEGRFGIGTAMHLTHQQNHYSVLKALRFDFLWLKRKFTQLLYK